VGEQKVNRTSPITSRSFAPQAEHVRTCEVWLIKQRQDLIAPATALLELSTMLLKDAQDRGEEEFLRDQQQICGSSQQLVTMIENVLDPRTLAAGDEELAHRVRHDLRTPLTVIIGLAELWLEEAPAKLLEGFTEDLAAIHASSQQLLASLDAILEFAKTHDKATVDLHADKVKPIRELVKTLTPQADDAVVHVRINGSVLVIDDNAAFRSIFARRLERFGHTVATAENAADGLARLRRQPFDLILLDILMPDRNGVDVLKELKEDTTLRHIPVIMISAFHETASVAYCIEMGAEDYLPKPCDAVLLRARIDACLEKKALRDRELQHLTQLIEERRRVNELLHVILPDPIVRELKSTNAVLPRRHDEVAVLFADIVGFTSFCDRSRPEEVIAPLQRLIETWEEIALRHEVEKIKTIGDAFMGAAGLLRTVDNPVLACVRCGVEMIAACQAMANGWNLRVGIHFGPVVAGKIGKRQYQYDLWGDTVNTAARMESNGVPGAVTLSAAAWEYVTHCCRGKSHGIIAVKGKPPLEMVQFVEFTKA